MIEEHIQDTASLYVLGLLDAADARTFEARMNAEPELARLVAELERAAAALADQVAPSAPPPEVRDRLLAQIRSGREPLPRTARSASWAWAAAASLAICCGWLAWERSQLRRELAGMEHRHVLSQLRIATLTAQLDEARDGVAAVAWDEVRQEGIIDVRNLPPPPDDRDYQLWVIDPNYESPVSAGVFQISAGAARTAFRPAAPISAAQKFAVSLEQKGGSARHSGPIVLLGE